MYCSCIFDCLSHWPHILGYLFVYQYLTYWLQNNFLLIKAIQAQKVGLKLNIQKTKIMASGPITSWEIDGETVETVADFIFLGSKITADGDAAMKLKDAYSLEGKL